MEAVSAERDAWIAFTGSPNDEPFLWTQEFFDTSVLTCMADGSSEEGCICLLERIEAEASLLDLLLGTELSGAAEVGLVEVNPVTGLPEGFPGVLATAAGVAFLDCFG